VTRGGAPTGKWETVPDHLQSDEDAEMRQAEVRLIVRRPGVPEVEIPVEKTVFVIGRLPSEVDLVLDDELVSRRHAQLTAAGRGYFKLEDLGSQNGICFQGRPVRRLNLVDGDSFEIGRTEIVFHAKMSRWSAPPPPKPTSRGDSEVVVPDPAEPQTEGADAAEEEG
jgi:pSer/pThr/pTyr-binding forkhead associated (FHA) protein